MNFNEERSHADMLLNFDENYDHTDILLNLIRL